MQRIKLIRNPTRHVKQIFGKDEVTGSNPVISSMKPTCDMQVGFLLCLLGLRGAAMTACHCFLYLKSGERICSCQGSSARRIQCLSRVFRPQRRLDVTDLPDVCFILKGFFWIEFGKKCGCFADKCLIVWLFCFQLILLSLRKKKLRRYRASAFSFWSNQLQIRISCQSVKDRGKQFDTS